MRKFVVAYHPQSFFEGKILLLPSSFGNFLQGLMELFETRNEDGGLG